MNTELATIFSSATSGAKNLLDIANTMVNKRKGNQLITKGEMKMLEVAINEAITRERMYARHELGIVYIKNIDETYKVVKNTDINSPIGLILMQEIQSEARSYNNYLNDFDRITGFRGF